MLLLKCLRPLVLIVPLAVLGCGGGEKSVSGEIVPGAVPFEASDRVSITLEGDGKSFGGVSDSNKKFSVADVTPGTYKVKVVVYTSKSPPGSPTSVPRMYPEEWKVPGGPYKLDLSKLQ